MRVNRILVLLAAALLFGWSLGASDNGLKIGVVDLDQAVTSTDEGKAAVKEFERKKREAEAELQPMVEKFQEMMKELEAKKFVLSDDALFQKRLDVEELRNEIQGKQKQIEGRLQVDRERLVGPLRTKLVAIIEELGRKEGFSMILQRQAPGLMYSREALDITDLVIEKFDKS